MQLPPPLLPLPWSSARTNTIGCIHHHQDTDSACVPHILIERHTPATTVNQIQSQPAYSLSKAQPLEPCPPPQTRIFPTPIITKLPSPTASKSKSPCRQVDFAHNEKKKKRICEIVHMNSFAMTSLATSSLMSDRQGMEMLCWKHVDYQYVYTEGGGSDAVAEPALEAMLVYRIKDNRNKQSN